MLVHRPDPATPVFVSDQGDVVGRWCGREPCPTAPGDRVDAELSIITVAGWEPVDASVAHSVRAGGGSTNVIVATAEHVHEDGVVALGLGGSVVLWDPGGPGALPPSLVGTTLLLSGVVVDLHPTGI